MAGKPDDHTSDHDKAARRKRMVDESADHWQVGPKTQEALAQPLTLEELDALIPPAEEE